MSVGVDGRWGCFGNSYPECRTQQRERSTIEESRKRVLRLRFKFGVIGGNDSGVGVFVSIMNGLISRRRRLHNPEIDVTTDDGRSDCCRNSGPSSRRSTRVARGLWPRSFVNSSSGSMITGWTPTRPSERASREGEGLRQWMRRAAAAVAAIAFEGRSDSLRSSSVTPRGGMSRKLVTHDSPMCLGHAHCWTGLMKYFEALIADILCDFFICSTWWVR